MTVNQSPRMTVDYQEMPNSFYKNPMAFRMMLDSMPQTWIRSFFRHAYEDASGGKQTCPFPEEHISVEKKTYPDNTELYYVRIPGPPAGEQCGHFAAAYGFVFPKGGANGHYYTVDSDGKTTLCISWADPATGNVDAASRAGRNREENMARMHKLATTSHSQSFHSTAKGTKVPVSASETGPKKETKPVITQNTASAGEKPRKEQKTVQPEVPRNNDTKPVSSGSAGAIRRFLSMALLIGQLVYVSFFVPSYRVLHNISYSGAMTCILTFVLPLVLVLLVYASGLKAKTRYKAERMPLKYQGTDKDDPDVVLKGGLRRIAGWALIVVQIVKFIRNRTGFTRVVIDGGFFNWVWYLLPAIAGLLLLRWALIARTRGKVLTARYEAVKKFDAMNQEPAAVHTAEAEAESHDYDFELTNETTDTPVIPDRGPVIPPDPPEAFWSVEDYTRNFEKFMKELEAFAEALGDLIAASEQERNAFLQESEVIDPETESLDSKILKSLELLNDHWVRIVNQIPGHSPVTAQALQYRKNTASSMPLKIRYEELAGKADNLPYYPGSYQYTQNIQYTLRDAGRIWGEVESFRQKRNSTPQEEPALTRESIAMHHRVPLQDVSVGPTPYGGAYSILFHRGIERDYENVMIVEFSADHVRLAETHGRMGL